MDGGVCVTGLTKCLLMHANVFVFHQTTTVHVVLIVRAIKSCLGFPSTKRNRPVCVNVEVLKYGAHAI